jgi:Cu2+-containing amine oxidase
MQAGWYRYISDWRLRDDGTIAPRFGFAGTRNPRTCMRHQHHVYWRLDFDIEGAGRDAVEERGLFFPGFPLWWRLRRETKRLRTVLSRSWRVVDTSTGRGYSITPGPADGTADSYGVADLWALRYRGTELDDGVGVVGGTPADTQCRLDQYLTGESIDSTDVVVWYAGHFVHDEQAHTPHQGHIVGPELRPIAW